MFSRPRIKLKSVHISCNCHRQNSTNPHSTLFTFVIFKWKNKKQKEENNAPRLCMKSVRTHASMLLYTKESEEGSLYKMKSTWICSLHFNPSPSVHRASANQITVQCLASGNSSMFPLATSGIGFLIWNRNKMNFSWKENSFYLQLQTIIIKTIVWHLGGFNSWHVTPSHSNHMVAMISTATQTHLFQPQWTKISWCNKACNSCSWRASFKRTLSAFSCFLSCIHCCSL